MLNKRSTGIFHPGVGVRNILATCNIIITIITIIIMNQQRTQEETSRMRICFVFS